MQLQDLLQYVEHTCVTGSPAINVNGITSDSRMVGQGYAFFGIEGTAQDGAAFFSDAIARGATSLFSTKPVKHPDVTIVVVENMRKAVWQVACAYYGFPAKKLCTVGITGTNGKTTSTYLLASVLSAAGHSTGVIGTIQYIVGGKQRQSRLTTPDPILLHSLLADMLDAGDDWVVMEVSSHSLAQERNGGIAYDGAIFTNLTRDHLDYHRTMENYASAKAKLFEMVKPDGVVAVNFNDTWGPFIASRACGNVIPFGFGLKGPVQLDEVSLEADYTRLSMMYGERRRIIRCPLVGRFNAYNVLGVATIAYGLGIEADAVAHGLEHMKNVPGRLERVGSDRPRVYVDYAHTDDALANALNALKELPHAKLHVVFGCGGDRDNGKRPMMGSVARLIADRVIVTSDNPRSEDPDEIISQILEGISDRAGVDVLASREAAIHLAVQSAHPDDIVLIAGKGHENCQILAHETIHFDDREVANEALKLRS